MKVHRVYRCDYGHDWTHVVPDGSDEPPEHALCPEGHEAVTMVVERPTDEVQILFRPAARVLGRERDRVINSGLYTLVLLAVDGNELRESSKRYTWEGLIMKARPFSGKQVEEALRTWDLKPP